MPEVQPENDKKPMASPFTRRRLLGGAAVTGAALASLALPGNVRQALADPMPAGRRASLRDIKHVVLLMQENRSFDQRAV
jgi:phospholipase C